MIVMVDNYTPYYKVKQKIVSYKNFIAPQYRNIPRRDELVCALLYFITDRVFSTEKTCGLSASVDWKEGTITIGNKGEFYEQNPLCLVYRKLSTRIQYIDTIRTELSHLHTLPDMSQCLQKKIKLDCIGSGCYGCVYKSNKLGNCFAVKLTKLKEDAINNLYNRNISSWHELFILQDMLKPLLMNKVCPNLPLLIDRFTCSSCELVISDEKTTCSCIQLVTELADYDLKTWLKTDRTNQELYSCLFQIMAGLHAIQHHYQIMNYDIKKENILVFSVEKGGYWKYTIYNKNYYVPNLGYLFILNDFGISRSMHPDFVMCKSLSEPLYKLGSRYGYVADDGTIIPIKYKKDSNTTTIKWSDKKTSQGVSIVKGSKFNCSKKYSDIIFTNRCPPFEFYNDTQDVIRMFCGGKRTTQRGDHKAISNKQFIKQLSKYIYASENHKTGSFPLQAKYITAGFFITDFFTFYLKPQKYLECYEISKTI